MPVPAVAQPDLPGTAAPDPDHAHRALRVRVDGKFFRLGDEKFYPKGVTYGPFGPNAAGEPFPEPEQTARDFAQIRDLGANLIRVYDAAPLWLLDLAREHRIKVLVDVPWPSHACFLDSPELREAAREMIRRSVRVGIGHPAVFAYGVVNEIAPDVVRWSGAAAVEEFIDSLIHIAKKVDPACLCTFGNYPPTEYLNPSAADFRCFNVYLHEQAAYENYLARLQMIADDKPLLLGETGVDSRSEGEERKCELLSWQIESAFRGGLAGVVVFSYSDDWWKDGAPVEGWEMGLTDRERRPKPSFDVVRRQFTAAPHFPLPKAPKVSVVVASYNGAGTLIACLKSLTQLRYPNYEVILVDDGSDDDTCRIASSFPDVRYVHQRHQGLSVARNTGIAAARGEIVAFTDADCRADEDWLYYLIGDLLRGRHVAIGGHNFLPPEDSTVAAAVMASPGGPAHVMLTDRIAEHIPGCNMAFYKWALEAIDGFDPVYHRAGDDVDICWRLQQRGFQIGFSPGGYVWHYRRSTIRAYLRQQQGYGEAEALLVRKHPEYFNTIGASIWRGRIYGATRFGPRLHRSMIYHGTFGAGWYQTLYQASPAHWLMFCTSLEYYVLVSLPLLLFSMLFPWLLPIALLSLAFSAGTCLLLGAQSDVSADKRRFWSKGLVALLYFLQPVVRGWARYHGRLTQSATPEAVARRLNSLEFQASEPTREVAYLTGGGFDRQAFLKRVMAELEAVGWQHKPDTGWNGFDLEIYGNRWCSLQLITAGEPAGNGFYRVKCRFEPASSLPAKVVFWTMVMGELMAIGWVRDEFAWIWLLLLTLPVFALFLDNRRKHLQRLVALFLDEVARRNSMVRLTPDGQPVTGWVVPSAGNPVETGALQSEADSRSGTGSVFQLRNE